MKIIFIVNTLGLTGGIKVILEYANRLSERGHDITVVHLLKLDGTLKNTILSWLKKIKYVVLKIFDFDKPDWFELSERVKILRLIDFKNISKADVVIATANETADWVSKLPEEHGKKFYFIQDYENWTRDVVLVNATYRLPLNRITVSDYLANKLSSEFGIDFCGVIKNGIDLELFNCKREKYNNKKILMQYHILPKKGINIGLEIFRQAQKNFSDIELILYGAYKPSKEILKEFQFFYMPAVLSLKEIFNNADIFLFTSLEEGFGLPPMEAMASGCAVVSFDAGAINEYATDKYDILLAKPGDKATMLQLLLGLLADKKKLEKIANNAYVTSRSFGWKNSVIKLEKILIN